MSSYVLGLAEVDRRDIGTVGGKGANLGELGRIDGVRVPPGFCVTTAAFERLSAEVPEIEEPIDRLSHLQPEDRELIAALSADIRRSIEAATVPDDVSRAISDALAPFGDRTAFAVRSSATAEDLPTASFAGQQDSYLNAMGSSEVLQAVRRCWASLFTEWAVTYRLRNGFDHRQVGMAVVVQEMVVARAAGILFTADPVTSNRKVAVVEAVLGLGEAMVSGLVDADSYRVRDGRIISKDIATKAKAIVAHQEGGTRQQPVEPERQGSPALTDSEAVELAELGRRIESHFGVPQDVEWCVDDQGFQVVQSRPITTLFPVPEVGDGADHVFVSVGHQQMMTDPMRPLGLSMWQLTALRPMYEAGGRLFVDVIENLASPASRAGLMAMLGRSDPLIGDALQTIVDRGDIVPTPAGVLPGDRSIGGPPGEGPPPIDTDPDIVTELIGRGQASIDALERDIRHKTGTELLDFIRTEIGRHMGSFGDPRSLQVIMAGMEATWWLNDKLLEWLGEENAAHTLTQSVPNNVTSEMGLALLDVADAIRPHPEVVSFLRSTEDDGFVDQLESLPGGPESRDAITDFLDRYGMRCIGEIDITRSRWSERPTALLPVLLGNVDNFEPGAGQRRFEEGRLAALSKEEDVLRRLEARPDGKAKADEAKRMIDRVRTFAGYREYPKYVIVSRSFIVKKALLAEAARLVRDGVLSEMDDIFHLRFEELEALMRTNRLDPELLDRREQAFRSHQAFTPPRVITSDGEVIDGAYRRHDVPAGALVGVPVSAGTVEGRARIVHDMAEAALDPGDILVTTHTDPSWSPLFVAAAGLVTEVGGQMTHGAVIAREYGLPAVVGVEQATRLISDGQRIRVHGAAGYVEILT